LFQLPAFFPKLAAQDGKASPSFGVKTVVVQMERRGNPFSFPLVLTEEADEVQGPLFE
jgi:hypothetical protein